MKKGNTESEHTVELSLKNEIIALIVLFVSIFFIFSIFSYTPADRSFFNSVSSQKTVENYGGPFGAQVAAFVFNTFGYGSYIVILYMLFITAYFLMNKTIPNMLSKNSGYIMLIIAFSSFLAVVKPLSEIDGVKAVKTGGIIGHFLGEFMRGEIKTAFAALFYLIFIAIGLVLVARISLRNLSNTLFKQLIKIYAWTTARIQSHYEKRQALKRARKIGEKYNLIPQTPEKPGKEEKKKRRDKDTDNDAEKNLQPRKADIPDSADGKEWTFNSTERLQEAFPGDETETSPYALYTEPSLDEKPLNNDFSDTGDITGIPGLPVFSDAMPVPRNPHPSHDSPIAHEPQAPHHSLESGVNREKARIAREPSRLPEEGSLFADFEAQLADIAGYRPPPLSYLDAPGERSKIDIRELEEKKLELSQRMSEFRIKGVITEYIPGPVITTYEFVPDTGVKVKDVTALSEDLALVAKAQYVRIERILGKRAIGIEIPNKKREVIHLREVLESRAYQESRSPLTIGLGKTKSGDIFISDLREMPHLIIAGATGSGKSVAVHSMLLSILFKASPEEVKLVLIDPKRVEMALYNTLPHLLTPVVVNTKFAKNALDWAVFEMEERYKKLALLQVRNLEQYNKKIDLLKQSDDPILDDIEKVEKLPYVVFVIDEFADLMMECGKDIETGVARIAQKARAVGIHLILATQRPSIDVITGTIKNNFPSRIALAVPSKHDSRTIIDVMGAEKLLGNGDMLFLPPKTATLVRLHCAYVSEEEILRVIHYLSKMGRPKFDTSVVKPKAESELTGDDDLDEMFFEAAEVVIATGQASASYLQRKMSIGYARAGRLIDQLQKFTVVSAPDTKNRREILMTLAELDELKKNGQ